MRVLVVAAHADDETLGCGGTIARLVREGHEVHAHTICEPRPIPGKSFMDATKILGIYGYFHTADYPDQKLDTIPINALVGSVEFLLRASSPELVLTHAANDRNLDHRIVHDAVLTACRPVNGCTVKKIMCFEVPSSTEWGSGFNPNVFVDVSGKPWEKKMLAWECYKSEHREHPHPRDTSALFCLGRLRGATAGVHMAEAFELVREVL